MSKLLKITAVAAAPVVALSLMAAPASAQSRDRDNTGRNALIGAAVGNSIIRGAFRLHLAHEVFQAPGHAVESGHEAA